MTRPDFVPDPGMLDALCRAGLPASMSDCWAQYHPEKWLPIFAGS